MNRSDLAKMFAGTGAELGVAAGLYSAEILANLRVDCLWSIDRWSDHHNEAEYQQALERLKPFGERSRVLRRTFADALPAFADATFDFLYVDGYAHTGQEGGQTLEDWWPKVKSGGIFAGHDYHQQWQPTIEAVDAFAAARGLNINLASDDQYPSWWMVKP